MLLLAADDDVYLAAAWVQRAKLASRSEQQHFRDVAEVKPDAASVRAAVFAGFVPDDVSLVGEPPAAHDLQPFHEQGVRAPEIKVAFREGMIANGQGGDF